MEEASQYFKQASLLAGNCISGECSNLFRIPSNKGTTPEGTSFGGGGPLLFREG